MSENAFILEILFISLTQEGKGSQQVLQLFTRPVFLYKTLQFGLLTEAKAPER